MIVHIHLMAVLLLIPFGVLLLSQLHRLYRNHAQAFLRPLFLSITFSLVPYFFNFIPVYIRSNIPPAWTHLGAAPLGKAFLTLWPVLNTILILFSKLFLAKAIGSFQPKRFSAWLIGYFRILFLVISVIGACSLVFPEISLFKQLYYSINFFLIGYSSLPLLIQLLRLRTVSLKSGDRHQNLALSFAVTYLLIKGCEFVTVLGSDLVSLWNMKLGHTLWQTLYVGNLMVSLVCMEIFLMRRLIPFLRSEQAGDELERGMSRLMLRYQLTKRESEVVRLIVTGKSNKEIGVELKLSLSTVKNHVFNIYQKIQINSRFELIDRVGQLEKEI